jgi:DNA-binding HxlR family transcriptional regulator
MSRPKPPQSPCPIGDFLSVLAGPWTLHILWVLGNDGPTRFGELRRKVPGISSRMLSDRLRLLEERGFIYRHYERTIPPAVTYGITDRMKDINKVLAELEKLARTWGQEDAKRNSAGSHERPTRANHAPRAV